MKTKAFNAVTALLLLSFSCGCVTHRLWQDKAFNEPSTAPNVQLYYSEMRRDVLVTYDEVRPASDTIRRRGYYLLENSNRQAQGRKPVFVDLTQTNQLQQIPVFVKGTTRPTNGIVCVVSEADAATFKVFLNDKETGPHDLPVYPSGFHRGTQLALTPAAVVADTAIVGSVVGLIAAYFWAAGHTSNSSF
jgi:hypothetical protein